jgi:hypothetical protein
MVAMIAAQGVVRRGTLHFKGASWHFTHTSAATTRRAEQSKAVQKLAKHGPTLPGSLRKMVSQCAR